MNSHLSGCGKPPTISTAPLPLNKFVQLATQRMSKKVPLLDMCCERVTEPGYRRGLQQLLQSLLQGNREPSGMAPLLRGFWIWRLLPCHRLRSRFTVSRLAFHVWLILNYIDDDYLVTSNTGNNLWPANLKTSNSWLSAFSSPPTSGTKGCLSGLAGSVLSSTVRLYLLVDYAQSLTLLFVLSGGPPIERLPRNSPIYPLLEAG